MLTPRRSGPISPEEIGNGTDANNAGAPGNSSGACARNLRGPGTYVDVDERAKEFLSTGRAGRRNALTDFLDRQAESGIKDLPNRFEELTVETDKSKNEGQDTNSPSTSKQQG